MTNSASITASLGLDRSSWRGSLARAEAEAQGFGAIIKNTFSTLGVGLGAGAVVAWFSNIVEKAHEIHHEAERFGIDAQQLQMIGNAAEQEGVQLESVARAMSRLVFAEASAAEGNAKMSQAFATLRINLATFRSLNPEQKMLALADAVRAAGLNTETFNAVAELLGKRFGTELIPLLLKGGDAIQGISKQMGVMNDETVNKLNNAYETWKTFWNHIVIASADSLSTVIDELKLMGESAKGVWTEIADVGVATWGMLSKAAKMDFKGSADAWEKGWAKMKSDASKNAKDIEVIINKIAQDYFNTGKDLVSLVTGTAAAASGKTGGATAGGSSALANEGMWETSPGKAAAAPGFGFGTIEGREAERFGEFGDWQSGIKGSRDLEREAAFEDRWAGAGLGRKGGGGGGDKLKQAFGPTEQKLDRIAENTKQQFVNK